MDRMCAYRLGIDCIVGCIAMPTIGAGCASFCSSNARPLIPLHLYRQIDGVVDDNTFA